MGTMGLAAWAAAKAEARMAALENILAKLVVVCFELAKGKLMNASLSLLLFIFDF